MEFDFTKLHWRIVEKFGTRAAFAMAMDYPLRDLDLRLNNRLPFSTCEIVKICEPGLLDISGVEIDAYFFTPKVR